MAIEQPCTGVIRCSCCVEFEANLELHGEQGPVVFSFLKGTHHSITSYSSAPSTGEFQLELPSEFQVPRGSTTIIANPLGHHAAGSGAVLGQQRASMSARHWNEALQCSSGGARSDMVRRTFITVVLAQGRAIDTGVV